MSSRRIHPHSPVTETTWIHGIDIAIGDMDMTSGSGAEKETMAGKQKAMDTRVIIDGGSVVESETRVAAQSGMPEGSEESEMETAGASIAQAMRLGMPIETAAETAAETTADEMVVATMAKAKMVTKGGLAKTKTSRQRAQTQRQNETLSRTKICSTAMTNRHGGLITTTTGTTTTTTDDTTGDINRAEMTTTIDHDSDERGPSRPSRTTSAPLDDGATGMRRPLRTALPTRLICRTALTRTGGGWTSANRTRWRTRSTTC